MITTGACLLLLISDLQAGEGAACKNVLDCEPKHECKLNRGSGKKECHKNKFFVCKNNNKKCTEVCETEKLQDTGYVYGTIEVDDFGTQCHKSTACLCQERPN